MRVFARILIVLVFCSGLQAEEPRPSLPACIEGGFKIYQSKGKEEAAKYWADHSTPLGKWYFTEGRTLDQMSKAESNYGHSLRAEMIGEVSISPSNKYVYVAWCLESGALFFEFQCYKPHDEWQILLVRFGNDKSFLPATLFGQQPK